MLSPALSIQGIRTYFRIRFRVRELQVSHSRVLSGDLQRRDPRPSRRRCEEEARTERAQRDRRLCERAHTASDPQCERMREADGEGVEESKCRRYADEHRLVTKSFDFYSLCRAYERQKRGGRMQFVLQEKPAKGQRSVRLVDTSRKAELSGSRRFRTTGEDR